ncbi:MAG: YfbU family protein [Beijerinckiaceae bacterium]|nr:YfbU family protein [Beijerinckiaceae bacterium]
MATKSERLELRVEEAFLQKIDEWGRLEQPGAPRSQLFRMLIEKQLESQSLKISDGEKLILYFLSEIIRKTSPSAANKIDVILEGFRTGNHWVIDWEIGELSNPPKKSKADAEIVMNTLHMWDVIEKSYEGFSKEQRSFVDEPTYGEAALVENGKIPDSRSAVFNGFDENTEQDLIEIANFIVKTMGRFPRFQGRKLQCNAIDPTQLRDQDRLNNFKKFNLSPEGTLSPNEIRDILITRSKINFSEAMAIVKKDNNSSSSLMNFSNSHPML